MSFVAAAIGGSALLGAGASIYAANKQAKGAGQAADAIGNAGALARQDLQPWVQGGGLANNRLLTLLGLGSGVNQSSPEYQKAYNDAINRLDAAHQAKYGMSVFDPRADAASRESQIASIRRSLDTTFAQNAGAPPADYGSLLKPFTGDDLQNEPGYAFAKQQGEDAINRAAAGRGSYDSGATLKALLRFNNDYASTKYNDAFNRDAQQKNQTYGFLSGQSGQGANAAGQTAGIGANTANAAGQYLASGADAGAAGIVGAANAATSGLGSYLGYQNNQQILDYLKGVRGSSSIGTGYSNRG